MLLTVSMFTRLYLIHPPACPALQASQAWLSKSVILQLWGWLILAAIAIVFEANASTLDLQLADAVFDWQKQGFRYQHAPFLVAVMHEGVKQVLIALLCLLLLLWFLPRAWRPQWLRPQQRHALGWVLGLALVNSALVSALKSTMPHACPWALARYGGSQPWAPSFIWQGHGIAGHCFPAGHATTALWLSGFCLFFLPHAPRRAGVVWLACLSMGAALGVAQQLRGAHFLSHTLTSMWLVSALLLGILTFSKARL